MSLKDELNMLSANNALYYTDKSPKINLELIQMSINKLCDRNNMSNFLRKNVSYGINEVIVKISDMHSITILRIEYLLQYGLVDRLNDFYKKDGIIFSECVYEEPWGSWYDMEGDRGKIRTIKISW